MNKIRKNSVISLLVFTAFIAFLFFYIGKRFEKETALMSPVMSAKLTDDVYAIRNDYVNFFILKKNTSLIAVDAGIDEKALSDMRQLGLDPLLVTAVFLTHSDNDHVGGLSQFPNAEVYLFKDEEQMINGTTRRAMIFKNKLSRKHLLVNENEIISVGGFSVKMIALPGHTPGSAAILVDGENIFTGDSISIKNGKAELFNDFFNMNSLKEKESIGKLKKLKGIKHLFTAHYGYSDTFENLFK